MKIIPLTLAEANDFIEQHHRHHKRVQGHRFSIGLEDGDGLMGVCVVGRPVARNTDWKTVAEVTRLCTNGGKNACSKLYSTAAAVAKLLGFHSIQTFILETESGVSLKASGWEFVSESAGGQWKHTDGKPRRTDQPTCRKLKYEKRFVV